MGKWFSKLDGRFRPKQAHGMADMCGGRTNGVEAGETTLFMVK